MGIFIHPDQEERFWAAALGAGSRVGRLLLNSHSGPLCLWLPPLLAPSWAGISLTERPRLKIFEPFQHPFPLPKVLGWEGILLLNSEPNSCSGSH